MPLTDGGAEYTLQLVKWLLAAWKWRFAAGAIEFCPPAPSLMSISQFRDEGIDLHDQAAWMLAYTCALQLVGEAAEGRHWHPDAK